MISKGFAELIMVLGKELDMNLRIYNLDEEPEYIFRNPDIIDQGRTMNIQSFLVTSDSRAIANFPRPDLTIQTEIETACSVNFIALIIQQSNPKPKSLSFLAGRLASSR